MLEGLQLTSFRNHTSLEVIFQPHTIITGQNGAGKTNILEAVALLSLTTSWKTEKDSEVIQWGQPFARVVSGDRELVVQRHPYYKRIRIDGISKRVGEVIGTLPSVLFQPDDSALVYGSPTYRRQALDRLLSQTAPGYLRALTQVQKVIKQRNKLLKQIQEGEATESEIEYWDEQLSIDALIIKSEREKAVPVLAECLERVFHQLVDSDDRVDLVYEMSPRHIEGESLIEHLKKNRYKEIAAGVSLYGPHREDLLFTWGEHLVVEGMSRGQVRALVLAFKLAEVQYITTTTGSAPILLLDDIFSEFDEVRRQRVTDLTRQYQTILTTTEVDSIQGINDSHIIKL